MARIVVILMGAGLLILSGCDSLLNDKSPQKEITSEEEARKAELLAKIENKYENPEAHYELGKLYYADGMLDKADFEYRVTIGFDPVHYRAQAGVVRILTDQKETERARIVAEMYMNQAAVSAEASLRLGKAFQNEGLDEWAILCYQQAGDLAPNSAVVFKQIGYFYLAKGDQVRAEENLRRSFQLDPYQSEVAGELGRMGIMVQIPRKEADNKALEQAVEEEQ